MDRELVITLTKHLNAWEVLPSLKILNEELQKDRVDLWIPILFAQLHRFIGEEERAVEINFSTLKIAPKNSLANFEFIKSYFYRDEPFLFNFELDRLKGQLSEEHLNFLEAFRLHFNGLFIESNNIIIKTGILDSNLIDIYQIDVFGLYINNLFELENPEWIQFSSKLFEKQPNCSLSVFWRVKTLMEEKKYDEALQLIKELNSERLYQTHAIINLRRKILLDINPENNGNLVALNQSVSKERNWSVSEVCNVLALTDIYLKEHSKHVNDFFIGYINERSVCDVKKIPEFLEGLYSKTKHPEVLKNLGDILFTSRKDYAKAAELYEAYLNQKPQNSRVLKKLRQCYINNNDESNAQKIDTQLKQLSSAKL